MPSGICLLVMNCALRAIGDSPSRTAAAARMEGLTRTAQDFNIPSLSAELAGGPDFRLNLTRQRGIKTIATDKFDASRHVIAALGNKPSRLRFLLCGFEAHISVYQTATGLLQEGAQVLVVSDAIAASGETDRIVAMQKMADSGAGLTTAEMLAFEWMSTINLPACRDVLARLAPSGSKDGTTGTCASRLGKHCAVRQAGAPLIGDQIRNARLARGLQLTDLGRIANCSLPHLSKIENSKGRPSLKLLLRISKALGKDINYFLEADAASNGPEWQQSTPPMSPPSRQSFRS